MTILIVVVFISLSLFVAGQWRGVGWPLASVGAVLISLCLFPALLSTPSNIQHVGMAPPIPELRVFGVVIAVCTVVAIVGATMPRLTYIFLPFALWLAFGMITRWTVNPLSLSGVWQYSLGIGAWIIGMAGGARLRPNSANGRVLVYLVAVIVAIQVAVSILQVMGLPINELSVADASILGNRINGTSNHPDNLGKMLILLIALQLPHTQSLCAATRRVANLTVLGTFIPLALAQGRANFIGALLVVVVWSCFTPSGQARGSRTTLLVGALAAGLFASGVFLARFEEDPTGGVRDQILQIAYAVIPAHFTWGLGPNNYVDYIGPIWGSYIPVHNSFLLAAAEVGVPGAAFLFAPFVLLLVLAWRGRRLAEDSSASAKSILAVAPAILLIGLTGWGLLGSVIWPLWTLVTGCLSSVFLKGVRLQAAGTSIQSATATRPATMKGR